MDLSKTHIELVEKVYSTLEDNIAKLRARKSDSLTLAEKILYGHARNVNEVSMNRGEDFGDFLPDRVAMQDATAQMALLQFMQAELPNTAVPTTVHCDHLIQAYEGANSDLKVANKNHKEVFDFLRTASQKYNIGFWGPGAGIIHQVVLEQYAFPVVDIDSVPSPKYSTIAFVPPFTVSISATFKIMSFGEVHPLKEPVNFIPISFGIFVLKGIPAITSTASAPPTPIAIIPIPPAFGV